MSRTKNIVCLDCKKSLWIAQQHSGNKYSLYIQDRPKEQSGLGHLRLYSTEEHLKALSLFLEEHENHSLKFMDSEFIPDDIEDIEGDN